MTSKKRKRNNKQQPNFICGCCNHPFKTREGVIDHIYDAHDGKLVKYYGIVGEIDLRDDDEPSMADRAVEAEIAMHCGLPTDDAWLLGEG